VIAELRASLADARDSEALRREELAAADAGAESALLRAQASHVQATKLRRRLFEVRRRSKRDELMR
jgi:hypothetical protein